MQRGDAQTAHQHLLRANAAAPNQPHILNLLGGAARRVGDLALARDAFSRAGVLGHADAWRNLGLMESAEQRLDAAIAAFERAVALAPRQSAGHASLAQALERRHELARAKAHAEEALRLAPNNDVAALALAQVLLREHASARAEAIATEVAQRDSASLINKALAWGLIGEARDKSGAPLMAFEAFSAANALLLELYGGLRDATDSPYHPQTVERVAQSLSAPDLSAELGPFETPAPAFLVGFPRSGTTLLDQVLSSHSRMVCLEEQEHMAACAADIIHQPASWVGLTADDIAARRRRYWRSVGATPAPDHIVIDKLPLNIVFLPLIQRIFPDARVIVALRDPRDVILSCFQQRFGMNAAMAQLLTLETAAAYYDGVMSLLEACRARLALPFHSVRYEDVVGGLDTEARRLADFLGVPFEPAMLAFHETARRRAIATPSARQVVEPLYARSVGRWQRYAEPMAAVLPGLARWAERFGYAV